MATYRSKDGRANRSAKRLDLSLEQFDGIDCPNTHVPYLVGVNHHNAKAVIFRPRCKLWTCPVCGRINAWVWSFRANDGAHQLYDSGKTLSFVTITPHEKLTVGGSWWTMPKAWMKLQARVRRETGPFDYFAVPELHESRKVHLHMITTANLSKRWWKDNGRQCGFGYQNDAKEVWSAGGIIGYCNKYLVKNLAYSEVPKYTRRVRTSRSWPKARPREPPLNWQFTPLHDRALIADMYHGFIAQGYAVTLAGHKTAWLYVEQDAAD